MAFDVKSLVRAFSPRVMARALAVLDKSTSVVIGACWAAAFVMLVLAVFAVHSAVVAKRDAAAALAVEPSLPRVTNGAMNPRDIQSMVTRLQRQFPDIRFEAGANQTIVIRSEDGAKFHQWVTSLSYIDTMVPQFRWTLREFCVGACGGQGLMRAAVSGQKVGFSVAP